MPRYIRQYGYAFSWKRLCNFVKVLSSMGLSWLFRRPVVWGKPFMLMVEPTNYCNLKCPLCPSGNGQMTRGRGQMGVDDFKALIDEVGEHLILLMLWNQGEPFINRGLVEMIRYARDRNIPTLTSTNGHYIRTPEEARALVESGLEEIIFSLDGVDQETYERYRVGGDMERVLAGVRLLVQAREELGANRPVVNLQFIVMKHNEGDLARAESLAGELLVPGFDKFLVKTAQVYTDEEAKTFLPIQAEYQRYERSESGELAVKGQPVRGCKVLWYSSMVNWNGAVAPCCFDKNVDFGMGQAGNGRSFGEIWDSRVYMDFRRKILADRKSVDMCRNCSEGYRGMFSLVKEIRG